MSSIITVFIIALSVALDAFAVSVAGGIKSRKATFWDAVKVGVYFGGFQGIMPLIGWVLGSAFNELVAGASGWIAFILLSFIGLKMIKEALTHDESDEVGNLLQRKTLLFMALATSIDALVVGVTISLIGLPVLVSVLIIGAVTFMLSILGFLFGKKLGTFFAGRIEIIGGVTLVAIGLKILLAG